MLELMRPKKPSRGLLLAEQVGLLKKISIKDLEQLYLFYKPGIIKNSEKSLGHDGYVCGFSRNLSNSEGVSLRDYFVERGLDGDYSPEEMIAFGRLDKDTSGLLVLARRNRYPKFMDQLLLNPLWKKESILTSKLYRAKVKGLVSSAALSKIKTLKIPSKNETVIEVTVESIRLVSTDQPDRGNSSSVVEIEIHEGKHHQVKKMLQAIKHPVLKGGLHRVRFAMMSIGEMKVGQIRNLLPKEKKQLVKLYNEWLASERIRFNIQN